MKILRIDPVAHWWDWISIVLLYLILQTVSARLVATEWTPSLDLIRGFTVMGTMIGLALGYSLLSIRLSRWISFFYMFFMLPLQWTLVIEGPVSLEEKLYSVGGRLVESFIELFSRRPVEDPLFFIAIMSLVFWILSASAAFQLTRQQNLLTAVVPSLIAILLIQNYDDGVRARIWFLAFFIFVALLLLGRLNLLQEQKQWKDRRVFISPENSIDLTGGMAIAACVLILTAWIVPSSFVEIESARQAWSRFTRPWTRLTERLENAVSALDSPSGGKRGEFYGTELKLGQGFPLSETLMFTVEAPEIPIDEKPPRYYWRGRVYDHFVNGQWFTTGTTRQEFSPLDPLPPSTVVDDPVRFIFNTGEQRFILLYGPSQTVWISRPGSVLAASADDEKDIVSWSASQEIFPGETYQVEAVLNNPTIEELQTAGEEYPQWVTGRYLQLPENFSQRIRDLAQEITVNAETPYDKASAITLYLRENLEYSGTIPEPPRGADPLEWILFEHKKTYCVYYASAEVLMLRSLGIPARLAVGFAQGTSIASEDRFAGEVEEDALQTYTVRKRNAHAWPEVFFPGTGWVEFEPTGNQAQLERPLARRNIDNANGLTTPPGLPTPDPAAEDQPVREPEVDESASPLGGTGALLPLPYLIAISVSLAVLGIFLSRHYALPTRLPSMVRSVVERGGADVPGWVLNWERWVKLSSIERSFDAINFGLRQMREGLPVHATPAERAGKLSSLMPDLEAQIKLLLDEHQTYLYTSKTADAALTRRSALIIRTQVILARIRRYLTGRYTHSP